MSISDQRKRLAKLEKRQTRTEPPDMQVARFMGYCIGCAAGGHGSEYHRDLGRRFAITIARNRAAGRGSGDLAPWISDKLVRVLGGAMVEPGGNA
jgi:hypothetical protein